MKEWSINFPVSLHHKSFFSKEREKMECLADFLILFLHRKYTQFFFLNQGQTQRKKPHHETYSISRLDIVKVYCLQKCFLVKTDPPEVLVET